MNFKKQHVAGSRACPCPTFSGLPPLLQHQRVSPSPPHGYHSALPCTAGLQSLSLLSSLPDCFLPAIFSGAISPSAIQSQVKAQGKCCVSSNVFSCPSSDCLARWGLLLTPSNDFFFPHPIPLCTLSSHFLYSFPLPCPHFAFFPSFFSPHFLPILPTFQLGTQWISSALFKSLLDMHQKDGRQGEEKVMPLLSRGFFWYGFLFILFLVPSSHLQIKRTAHINISRDTIKLRMKRANIFACLFVNAADSITRSAGWIPSTFWGSWGGERR